MTSEAMTTSNRAGYAANKAAVSDSSPQYSFRASTPSVLPVVARLLRSNSMVSASPSVATTVEATAILCSKMDTIPSPQPSSTTERFWNRSGLRKMKSHKCSAARQMVNPVLDSVCPNDRLTPFSSKRMHRKPASGLASS